MPTPHIPPRPPAVPPPRRASRGPRLGWAKASGVVVAIAAAATSACRAVVDRAFQQPTVDFRGATVRGVGPDSGTVEVRAVVHNPNPYPLRAARARYRLLTRDSAEVGRGETTETLSVGARDSSELRLPVAVTWAGLALAGAGALADAGAGAPTEYRLVGEVVLASTPVGDVTVPVDARGRAVLRAPGGALGGALGGLLGGALRRR